MFSLSAFLTLLLPDLFIVRPMWLWLQMIQNYIVWISRWKFTLLGSQQLYSKATVYTNNIKEHINVYQCIYRYNYVYSHINIYNTHIDMIRLFDQYKYMYIYICIYIYISLIWGSPKGLTRWPSSVAPLDRLPVKVRRRRRGIKNVRKIE